MVTATFALKQYTLTVTDAGTGSGAVTSNPAGINCGTICSSAFDSGTVVTLTATAAVGSTFAGWSGGGCSGTGTCTLTMAAATAVTASFTIDQEVLTVTNTGTGAGTVTSNPAGINCGATCAKGYNYGTAVTLTAAAATGSTFAGWSGGGCSGTGTCTVTMTAATAVTATFTINQYTLTLSTTGNGSGTVTPSPAGTSCGAGCYKYNYGTAVTITAAAVTGSTFGGFTGGGCSTSPCAITITGNTTVSGAFTLNQYNITLATAGNGSGTIAIAPAGTSCGANCHTYNYGTSVTVTAAASTGSTFGGLSGGGCSTSPCTFTVTGTATVTATFTLNKYLLTVNNVGSGAGSVTSVPAGINCGGTCAANFDYNTVVTLTPTWSGGTVFNGWSGACSGTQTCTVTMTAARTVTATFTSVTAISWDPYWSVAGATFSNGNLSISGNSAGTKEVRTTFGQNTGKWYWEVTATAGTGANFGGLGIANFNFPNSAIYLGSAANSIGFGYGDGTYYWTWANAVVSPTSAPATAAVKQGNIYMFALDMDKGSFWAGMNGTWFNNGNPVTAANPLMNVLGAGIVFPAVTFYANSPNAFTANFGASQFAFQVPAGFNPGFYMPAGQCDAFTLPDSTTIPGWTEHTSDWFIDTGRIRQSATGGFYTHTISMNNSTQADGCAHVTAHYGTGPGATQAVGIVLRQTSDTSYTVALVQDNNNSGNFNQIWMYDFPNGTNIGSVAGSFGTNPIIQACVVGTTVTLRVDADGDGIYETSQTGTTTVAGAGVSGVMTHTFSAQPLADQFCWGF